MHNTHGKSIVLSEQTSWGKPSVEDGIIKGVKLLGEKSRNGNRYPLAVRKAAHSLFEGLQVNLNHQRGKEERSVVDRVGRIQGVHEREDGTYGDFAYLVSHPFAVVIKEAAERMPELMGFSIAGRGKIKTHNGENIVEAIDTLRSVDLVADPATNRGLFESEDEEPVDPDAAIAEAFCKAVEAVVRGGGDLKAKLKKIKEILVAQEKMGGKEEEAAPGAEAPVEAPGVEESWKSDYEALKREKSVRALLETHKVPVETALVESLMAMNSDKARTDFVTWHKRVSIVKSPRSSEPTRALSESVQEVKKWADILRSN